MSMEHNNHPIEQENNLPSLIWVQNVWFSSIGRRGDSRRCGFGASKRSARLGCRSLSVNADWVLPGSLRNGYPKKLFDLDLTD